ncbi:helix-turn-helix transcriptional regulator [Phycicoccus flavus]|uniref:helix-turn-helix transcriptional regulator n=1 Tax=Phycicoccus flavus TaxID=2502783 RepID=UPI000FEC0195|nr:LuxR C-terminal-related transcriptional regulator [Phycicoccus flavus]NHA69094.1 helix-turn-helix transcriptional regulator [Phycicoccus flavus]
MTGGTGTDQREFFRWAHGLVLAGDERFEPLGPVADTLRDGIGELAQSVRRSVWHMTIVPSWREVRAARRLAEVAWRADVDGRYVTDVRSLERLPMLSSHHPDLRTTHVVGPLLVVDARMVFLGVPRGHELAGRVWRSTSPTVVGAAARTLEAAWRAAQPPHEHDPPFTRRMVDVGFLLTDGATDGEISRQLAVSTRTVSADVAEIVRRLGARNRAHAIALIGGGTF